MNRTSRSTAGSAVGGTHLLALAIVSDRLLRDRRQLGDKQRQALQRLARGLYRALPDASRTAFLRHLHERYPAPQGPGYRHQHR